jgi:hypothetical protein
MVLANGLLHRLSIAARDNKVVMIEYPLGVLDAKVAHHRIACRDYLQDKLCWLTAENARFAIPA